MINNMSVVAFEVMWKETKSILNMSTWDETMCVKYGVWGWHRVKSLSRNKSEITK